MIAIHHTGLSGLPQSSPPYLTSTLALVSRGQVYGEKEV